MWTTCRKCVAATLMLTILSAPLATAQCSGYDVRVLYGYDCGLLGRSPVGFRDINDLGDACGGIGGCGKAAGELIIWDGVRFELQTSVPPGYHVHPLAINSQNAIAGIHELASGQNRGFVYFDGMPETLNPLPGHTWCEAYAISNDGTVVGYSNGSAEFWAVVWKGLKPSVLQLPVGPRSNALDISDSGEYICGWMGADVPMGFKSTAFVWHNGNAVDIGLLPGFEATEATAVNNLGQACGTAWAEGGPTGFIRHAFFWSDGVMQDIGALPGFAQSYAFDINDLGHVLGYSDEGDDFPRSFIWHNGVMQKLDDLIPQELGLSLVFGWRMNNAGQIAGLAFDENADQVGVILTPIPSPIGDFNCDSIIDVDDLLGVINHWADASPKGSVALPAADFNHDATVGIDDLMIVIDNWSR